MRQRLLTKYHLNETFQKRLLAVSFLHFFLIILTFSIAVFVPLMVQLDDPSLTVFERQGLANAFISLHERLWPALLAVLALLLVHVAIVSQRICGPLHRFRQIFKSIGEGDLSIPPEVRQSDYLRKEAEAIHDMVVSLRARMQGMEGQHEIVRGALDQVKHAVEGKSAGEAADSLRRLEEELDRLRTQVALLSGSAQESPSADGHGVTPVQAVMNVDKVGPEGPQ